MSKQRIHKVERKHLSVIGTRLFGVHNVVTNEASTHQFREKFEAKAKRDKLNQRKGEDVDLGWRVCVGPDHWRYQS
jgi:hypothetical protein